MLNYFLSAMSLSGAKTIGCGVYFTFDKKLNSLWVERRPDADRTTDPSECRRVVEAHCCFPGWEYDACAMGEGP